MKNPFAFNLTSEEKDAILLHTGRIADMAAKDNADDKDFLTEMFKVVEIGLPFVEKVVKTIF